MQSTTSGIGDEDLIGAGAVVQESTAPSAGFEKAGTGFPATDPDSAKARGELRQRLQASFAKVVISMMTTARYKHFSPRELEHLVMDPLMRGRVAIALEKEGPAAGSDDALAGVAIWAKVSSEVDAKIREQIASAVFPIRLKPDDWASGEIIWLLDVIAPTRQHATSVLAGFRQMGKEGQLFVHPIVRELVKPAVLNTKPAEAMKPEAGAASVI